MELSVEDVAAVVPVLAEDVPPPLNALPPRLKLHFQVRYGLASGEQTLQWVNEGERYTLISVAEATGLAGVFYRGRFVQTSRGRMTPYGLQPEEFWDQRGDKHSRAHFNPEQGQLTFMPTKGAPRHFAYQGEVQDALSLFFQLALTAPPADRLTQLPRIQWQKTARLHLRGARRSGSGNGVGCIAHIASGTGG